MAVTSASVATNSQVQPVCFPASTQQSDLHSLLIEIERPLIPQDVRSRLEHILKRHGAEHVRMLLLTILESEGNENALTEIAVSAVSSVMVFEPEWPNRGEEWLKAFDKISLQGIFDGMRALKCFTVREAPHFYYLSLRNQLREILEPSKAKTAKPAPTRKTGAERAIEEGLFLLQHKGPTKTSPITTLGREKFGLDANDCSKVMNAARLYGDRIWLVKSLSRNALYELCAPSTPADVREAFERKLRLGERVGAPDILKARKSAP